jgi:DNA-binding NarL/FixJ family response regulator
MTLSALSVVADPISPPRPVPPTPLRRRLRARELRLLAVVATGAPMTAVAQVLGISDRTVRRRIRLLCEEIGVSTPIEAVVWAARQRLI